jgi:uncharacterized protein YdcH (DUF465 family)
VEQGQIKAIQDVLLEHDAYQVNINWLVSLIDESASLAGKSPNPDDVTIIRGSLRSLRTAIMHATDILIIHKKKDIVALHGLVDVGEMGRIFDNHDEISREMDRIQGELYESDNWTVAEMKEHVINLQQRLHGHQKHVSDHIAEENELLKRGLLKSEEN